ncbi:hypothetical protein P692DRAFT_201564059 [Suillus brevipes Sb2]|nr:hypothetical protein P692DRAFT_201564059 [Suillus brevipes Sb2]
MRSRHCRINFIECWPGACPNCDDDEVCGVDLDKFMATEEAVRMRENVLQELGNWTQNRTSTEGLYTYSMS